MDPVAVQPAIQYDRTTLVGYVAVHTDAGQGVTRIEVRRSSYLLSLGIMGMACAISLLAIAIYFGFSKWAVVAPGFWVVPALVGLPWLARSLFIVLGSKNPIEFVIDSELLTARQSANRTVQKSEWPLRFCADLNLRCASPLRTYWPVWELRLISLDGTLTPLFRGTRREAELIRSTIARIGQFPPVEWITSGLPKSSNLSQLKISLFPYAGWFIRRPTGLVVAYFAAIPVFFLAFSGSIFYNDGFDSWYRFQRHAIAASALAFFCAGGWIAAVVGFFQLFKTVAVTLNIEKVLLQELSYFSPCLVEWPTRSVVDYKIGGGRSGSRRVDIYLVLDSGSEECLIPSLRRREAENALQVLRAIHARCLTPKFVAGGNTELLPLPGSDSANSN